MSLVLDDRSTSLLDQLRQETGGNTNFDALNRALEVVRSRSSRQSRLLHDDGEFLLFHGRKLGQITTEDIEGILANEDIENSLYAVATRRQEITPRPRDDPDYIASLPERWKAFAELFTQIANKAGQLA